MKHFITLSLLFVTMNLAAQMYDYQSYNFPDLTIKGLSLGGNAFGNSRFILDTNRLNGNIQLSMNYFTLENTRKKQTYVEYGSNLTYSRQDQFLPFFQVPKHEFRVNFNSQGQNRLFHGDDKKGKQKFWEFDHVVNLDYYYFKYSDNNTLPPVISGDRSGLQSWVAVPVRMGKGRLEPLAGIPLAEFLADDLMESGLLMSPFSQEQLFELAQKIVAVDNARVFDFRRRNIYRLKELSAWLENQGVPMTIETFTILNDNYNFVFSGLRNQGTQKSLGIVPIFTMRTQFSNDFSTGYGLGLQYDWVQQKNLSKNLHKAWRATGSAYFMELDEVNVQSIIHAGIQHDFTYVPISRTIMSLSPFVSAMFLDMENFASIAGINGYTSYFINHQMRITGSLQANYFFNPLLNAHLVLPDLIMGNRFRFPATGDISRNLSFYQFFNEKFNFSGLVTFSYFLF